MSAFGGKADTAQIMHLITSGKIYQLHMFAFDPKRTSSFLKNRRLRRIRRAASSQTGPQGPSSHNSEFANASPAIVPRLATIFWDVVCQEEHITGFLNSSNV